MKRKVAEDQKQDCDKCRKFERENGEPIRCPAYRINKGRDEYQKVKCPYK